MSSIGNGTWRNLGWTVGPSGHPLLDNMFLKDIKQNRILPLKEANESSITAINGKYIKLSDLVESKDYELVDEDKKTIHINKNKKVEISEKKEETNEAEKRWNRKTSIIPYNKMAMKMFKKKFMDLNDKQEEEVMRAVRKENAEELEKSFPSDTNESVDEAKKDPKAGVRNRGKCVFPSDSPKVKDDKDHFPIGDIGHARNALSRSAQYSSAPSWYKGSLSSLKNAVKKAVKKAFPKIEVTESTWLKENKISFELELEEGIAPDFNKDVVISKGKDSKTWKFNDLMKYFAAADYKKFPELIPDLMKHKEDKVDENTVTIKYKGNKAYWSPDNLTQHIFGFNYEEVPEIVNTLVGIEDKDELEEGIAPDFNKDGEEAQRKKLVEEDDEELKLDDEDEEDPAEEGGDEEVGGDADGEMSADVPAGDKDVAAYPGMGSDLDGGEEEAEGEAKEEVPQITKKMLFGVNNDGDISYSIEPVFKGENVLEDVVIKDQEDKQVWSAKESDDLDITNSTQVILRAIRDLDVMIEKDLFMTYLYEPLVHEAEETPEEEAAEEKDEEGEETKESVAAAYKEAKEAIAEFNAAKAEKVDEKVSKSVRAKEKKKDKLKKKAQKDIDKYNKAKDKYKAAKAKEDEKEAAKAEKKAAKKAPKEDEALKPKQEENASESIEVEHKGNKFVVSVKENGPANMKMICINGIEFGFSNEFITDVCGVKEAKFDMNNLKVFTKKVLNLMDSDEYKKLIKG